MFERSVQHSSDEETGEEVEDTIDPAFREDVKKALGAAAAASSDDEVDDMLLWSCVVVFVVCVYVWVCVCGCGGVCVHVCTCAFGKMKRLGSDHLMFLLGRRRGGRALRDGEERVKTFLFINGFEEGLAIPRGCICAYFNLPPSPLLPPPLPTAPTQ